MRFTLCVFAALFVVPTAMGQDSRVPHGSIILSSPQQTVAAMLARWPTLRSAELCRQAVRADGLQAPLRPNPEVSIMAENFGGYGGRGEYRGGRAVETTLGLSQRVELGGQRGARMGVAGHNGSIATLDFEAARLDQARDVLVALAEAEAASRNVAVERERARLASETLRVARARVEAGRDPLIQQQRAEVTRVNAEISAERARREAELALDTLATLIGAPRAQLAPRQPWFDHMGIEPRPPPAGRRARANGGEPGPGEVGCGNRSEHRQPHTSTRHGHPGCDIAGPGSTVSGRGRDHLRRRRFHPASCFRPEPGTHRPGTGRIAPGGRRGRTRPANPCRGSCRG